VVVRDGKLLLIQEGNPDPDIYKKWWLPGGGINGDEDVLTATVREAKEESGYDVEPMSLLRIINIPGYPVLCFFLKAKVTGGEATVDGETNLDVRWVPLDDVMKLDIRDPWLMRGVLADLRNGAECPLTVLKRGQDER
jgi:ADP-ribose pyrophosphatase YjhB (NUDIX family)